MIFTAAKIHRSCADS